MGRSECVEIGVRVREAGCGGGGGGVVGRERGISYHK